MSADAFSDRFHHQSLAWLQIALAPEPILHRGSERVDRHTEADLQQTVSNRQRVVKNRVVGEVAHSKVVDPGDRTGVGRPIEVEAQDSQLAGKHPESSR